MKDLLLVKLQITLLIASILATRLTQLSDRLHGKQLLKNFHKPTKNGLKNTKNCTIDYNEYNSS
ncbi:MAG: hypothetical protein ACLBM4_17120 [Dolichospermum sp.]|nr:hypothetical protein [Dolichospermum circinale CS-537/05]